MLGSCRLMRFFHVLGWCGAFAVFFCWFAVMSIPSPIFWLGFYIFVVLMCCTACEFDAIRRVHGISEGHVMGDKNHVMFDAQCSGRRSGIYTRQGGRVNERTTNSE